MATNSGQGSTDPPVYPANSCNSVTVFTIAGCSPIAVNCVLYYDNARTIKMPAGTYKIDISNNEHRYYTVNANGVVTAIGQCSWASQSQYNTYAPIYTGSRNNCASGGTPQSITINNGGSYNYSGTSSYTSYISQADANSNALSQATTNFNNGIQSYINSVANCTFTSTQTVTCSGDFTRNNCGTDCYGTTVNYTGSGTETRTSIISQSDANSLAYNASLATACTNRDNNGQANANTYGTCCCWVSDTCSGCTYMANRQRNTCTGAYRYETVTAYDSCNCNVNCKGTNYSNNTCVGADLKDRQYYEIYNCNGAATGNSYIETCGCDLKQPSLTSTGYTTCSNCQNVTIFRDTGNRCSLTYNEYYVNGVSTGSTTMPSTASCNTIPNYSIDLGIKCVNGTNYYVLQNDNSCGNYRYKYYSGNETNYTNNLSDFGPACTFSAYRNGTFSRNNCGSGYVGGNVSYYNTYYYSGIDNQSGANNLADASFPTDGQNYANINGSCTAVITCYTYNIISNNDNVYVDGQYTTCAGYTDYFSFYSSTAYTNVGSVCAQASTVYVTANGFANSSGTC